MKLLSYTRVIGDKAVCLLRNLNHSSRASILSTQLRAEHSTGHVDDHDAPIKLENPFKKDKRICILCKHNIEPDYKNVRLLSQFQSRFTGRIYGRHVTGLCKSKQEKVEKEIYKAQHSGLMPYYNKNIMYVNDPKLFDIDNPFRPHKY